MKVFKSINANSQVSHHNSVRKAKKNYTKNFVRLIILDWMSNHTFYQSLRL